MTATKIESDAVDAVRTDGGLIRIRSITPDDAAGIRALHAAASDRSLYLRFFSVSRVTAESYVATLLRPSGRDHHALAACVRGRIVGVASFERLDDDAAEIALIVSDELHHAGIGTLLLEHLAGAARRVGVRRFTADVLGQNRVMARLLRDIGFATTSVVDHETTEFVLDLDAVEAVITAIDERDRAADAKSLTPLLAPRSIAVIGVSDRPDSVGYQVLNNILSGGFTGTVHVVNPHFHSILGVQSVPSPAGLPEAPDLSIIAVPADRVLGVVRACGERGSTAVLLLSAGFGELGAAGRALQDDVLEVAREYGMRLVGPNCVGLLNTDPAVRLNATFAALPLEPGGFGLLAQSGAFGIALMEAAVRSGLGISQFVSVGNKADVSGNDLLLRWERDPGTRVIGMYLESLGDPQRFARIARRVSRTKPILAIKSGRTAVGQRAGMSHTAAAASSDVAVEALFRGSGVLRMASMQDMLDAARVLNDQPLPAGGRVAIMGNSGGPGILATDAAAAAGLQIVELAPETREALSKAAASAASVRNPVDLGAGVPAADVEAALRVLLAAAEVDAVLTVFTEVGTTSAEQVRSALVRAAAQSDKPVVATEVGRAPRSIPIGGARSLPVFTFPEPAAAALAVAHRYARLRPTLVSSRARPDNVRFGAARALVDAARAAGRSWLPPDLVTQLLGHYGIPASPQREVASAEEAARAGAELGFPVAVKLAGGGIHKSDIGGVRLNVGDEAGLRRTYDELAVLIGDSSTTVLVQPMAVRGTELIVGAVRDDQFGPLIMIGAGGVLVDVLDDRAFRIAPLSTQDAESMIDDLRVSRVLDGYRGAVAVSRSRLCDVLLRVAALAADVPAIAELDINPLVCSGESLVVVDARIRVDAPPVTRDPLLRRLRASSTAPVGSYRLDRLDTTQRNPGTAVPLGPTPSSVVR
jgi:acyl-CoA synthetase (NDP forming)/GNAT superfamily N-acetyltransferase